MVGARQRARGEANSTERGKWYGARQMARSEAILQGEANGTERGKVTQSEANGTGRDSNTISGHKASEKHRAVL